tara:strand:+ start:275 stop:409 length:135 start_codon:yes stop_codon:yes gene_type:complete
MKKDIIDTAKSATNINTVLLNRKFNILALYEKNYIKYNKKRGHL